VSQNESRPVSAVVCCVLPLLLYNSPVEGLPRSVYSPHRTVTVGLSCLSTRHHAPYRVSRAHDPPPVSYAERHFMRPCLRLREQQKIHPTVVPYWRDMDSYAYRFPCPVFSPFRRQRQKSSPSVLSFDSVRCSRFCGYPRNLFAMFRSPHHKQIP
jgi:hypothetical protein